MSEWAGALIDAMLEAKVLRFGSFQTKSGRQSPYFFNFGAFDSGDSLGALADLYAAHIAHHFPEVQNLFGPAYKGIPLAVMVSERLGKRLGRPVTFSFDRKEAKDHGEGGWLVGFPYQGSEKVVVVEDVITGGTSLHHTIPRLQTLGVKVLGAVVGVDRQERGKGDDAAAKEVEAAYGVPVRAITNIQEIVSMLHNKPRLGQLWIDDHMRRQIDDYLSTYARI